MKTIVLKRKADAPFYITDQIIVDDLVTGLVANNYYIPLIDMKAPGIVFHTVDHFIDNYMWPVRDKVPQANLENFLKGHNPKLAATIEHYEDDSIVLDEIKSNQ